MQHKQKQQIRIGKRKTCCSISIKKNYCTIIFCDVLQTVNDISLALFATLISSVNSDIYGIIDGIKWIYKYLRQNMLKGLFIVYFSMVCGFIAGIVIVVFGRITKYTLAPAIDGVTKDNNGAGRSVAAALTETVGGHFQGVLSDTTVIVTIGICFDNGFIKIFTIYRCYCCITTKGRRAGRPVLFFGYHYLYPCTSNKRLCCLCLIFNIIP